jgi:glycogen synthase
MKILMTTDCVGGVWTYAMELCRALAKQEIEVVLATMGPRPCDTQREEARQLQNVTLAESEYKLEWQDDPWAEVRDAGQWLLSLESKHRPDVVHLNGYAHGCLEWRAPVVVVGHSCVLSWWRAVKDEDAPGEWGAYEHAVHHGLNAADAVVAPTHAMLACLEQHYGRLPRSRVIHNGRDAALFKPAHKQPLIFTAGRLWDEAKNLAAVEAVAAKVPWPIRVAGDERKPSGAAPLLQHVCAMGRLSTAELADQLGRASIYVLPARYEPFGLSVLEAALAGCALVLGDIASLREVWQDAAVYVDPDDPGALEAAIHDLIAHPDRRKWLGDAAHHRGKQFTPARMMHQYVELYHALASTPPLELAAPAYVGSSVNVA